MEKKKKLFKSSDEEVAILLRASFSEDPELKELEIQGFVRGLKRGKTMDVPLEVFFKSLEKQYKDWVRAFNIKPEKTKHKIPAMKKSLADLRNVAGITFMKLKEGGDKKE